MANAQCPMPLRSGYAKMRCLHTLVSLIFLSIHHSGAAAKPPRPVGKSLTRRGNISSLIRNNKGGDNDKTPVEIDFLKHSLEHGIPFNDLPEKSFNELVSSFEPVEYPKGSIIFKEGDADADFMFVVNDGECTISIEGKQLPQPYGIMGKGSMLGELALLYDSGRAATVTAATHVSAFRLSRDSFKTFLNHLPQQEEEKIKTKLLKIDQVIDKISGVKTRYKGDIIRKFKPMRMWLWTRWKGTIFQHAWKTAVLNMMISLAFSALIRKSCHPTWDLGMLPDSENHMISRLVGLQLVWRYLMTLTTFILTFFLSQAYGIWREMYSISRKIQGRMNDLGLLVACAAMRGKDGSYTPKAKSLLDDVASYSRLFHAFMWGAFTKKFNLLLGDTGLRRMMSRGLLSVKQYNTLSTLNSNVGPYNACLMWILIRCLNGMKDQSLPDDPVLREQIYIKILELRSTFATIPDLLDGRIPLAYAHFVQILVDAFVFLAPFALYSELGIWSTPAVGLLTLFYSGLLDLSKILLDPLDNDDFYNESVNMDTGVLIRESNAGSTRWKMGAEDLPF
jgi:hypothetical protein